MESSSFLCSNHHVFVGFPDVTIMWLSCNVGVNIQAFPDVRFCCAMMMRISHTHDVVGSLVVGLMVLCLYNTSPSMSVY